MSSQIFKSPWPYLALLLAHIIWGANTVVAKITLEEIPVMSLSFLRFSLAIILLTPFLITYNKKKSKIKFKDLPYLFLMGLFLVTFTIAFGYIGLKQTSAIDASVLFLIVPIVSVLAGWIFLKEKVFFVNILGILCGLFGALVILGIPLLFFGTFSSENLLGNVLILISGITFVVGAILSKKMLSKYSTIMVTAFAFLTGVVTFLIPAIGEFIQNPDWIYNVSILGILGLVYITFLSTISAFFMLEWGLSKISVTQANLFQYIEPAIAASLAVPILGERISFSFIIGTCLIVLGVYWGTLGKSHHNHLHHRHHR